MDVLVDADRAGGGGGYVRILEPGTGKLIGSLDIGMADSVDHGSGHANVEPEYQRQGVATLMYDWAESTLGIILVPSDEQTPAGEAFWKSWY